MTVFQGGTINTTALVVPDLYVQILPPNASYINGLPTNILGAVGTATWGPTNSPVTFGDMTGYAQMFGPIMPRKYDLGTAVAAAVLQGANNFRGVRVTDGTDTAASVVIQTSCLTVTSKYTGSLANNDTVTISFGTAANTWKATIYRAGLVPEVFDNIAGSGNALWQNIASAINTGQSGLRGPSQLVVAAAGAGTTAPTAQSYTLAGGTDGATTINGATLVGQDIVPRKGMYALRGTFASVAMLADCDDSTTWTSQVAFGLSEGVYMIGTGPVGDTIANAITTKATAGIDSYAFKPMFGDWIYWSDPVNKVTRLISPQGFAAGRLANLSPEQSSLNKQLYGIVGTQKSTANQIYSAAELGQLAQAGIDIIANPCPGGNYFGVRIGHNSSSDVTVNGDNYTRLTNYIAYTINSAMGKFVGKLQTVSERLDAKGALDNFLGNLEQQGMIGNVNGGPAFNVQLDAKNNPDSRVALGYQQADVTVKYLSVVEKFLVNVTGGQSVVVTRANANK